MFDLIYDFIRNDLIGTSQVMTQDLGDHLALLLTSGIIVVIFLLFCRLVKWAFGLLDIRGRFWNK